MRRVVLMPTKVREMAEPGISLQKLHEFGVCDVAQQNQRVALGATLVVHNPG